MVQGILQFHFRLYLLPYALLIGPPPIFHPDHFAFPVAAQFQKFPGSLKSAKAKRVASILIFSKTHSLIHSEFYHSAR